MDVFGEQCSMTERRADDATREVADWLKCEYMQDHVGEELEGVIANVTSFGFFVRLTDLHIDGLVHISNLANDYYQYDPIGQRLIGESFGLIYRLGDAVKVKVLSVNLNDKQIDFELVETSRKLRGKGKTAKKRAADAQKKAKAKKRASTKAGSRTKAVPLIEPTVRPDGSKVNESKGRADKAKKKSKGKKVRQKKTGSPNVKSRGQK
jgi:ribonuclease R